MSLIDCGLISNYIFSCCLLNSYSKLSPCTFVLLSSLWLFRGDSRYSHAEANVAGSSWKFPRDDVDRDSGDCDVTGDFSSNNFRGDFASSATLGPYWPVARKTSSVSDSSCDEDLILFNNCSREASISKVSDCIHGCARTCAIVGLMDPLYWKNPRMKSLNSIVRFSPSTFLK